MKRFWTGLISTGILIASMCSCGGEAEEPVSRETGEEAPQDTAGDNLMENESLALPEGYVWSARFQDAGRETEVENAYLIGNLLYYDSAYYDSDQGKYVKGIYSRENGKEPQQLLDYGYGDGGYRWPMAAGEDGSVYFLYGEEDEDGVFHTFKLEKRNQEMKEVYCIDPREGMEEPSLVDDIEARADGTLYGLTGRGDVMLWDENGVCQERFTLPESMATASGQGGICYGLVNAGDFGVYMYWGGKDQEADNGIHLYSLDKWREMDEEGRKAAEPLRVNFASAEGRAAAGRDDTLRVFSGYRDGVYLADKNRLWQINLTDGSLEEIVAWQDIYLKAEYVKAVRRQEDGTLLLFIYDTLEGKNYWVTLEAVPASELPEKKELVLGVAGTIWYNQSLASNIEGVVLSYHRMHPECHITIQEYDKANITNFQLELLQGEGPDILLERETFFDMEELADKGAVEDLMPYLMKADDVSSDILPGIMEFAAKEGKIPRIPLSFAVYMMIVPEDMPQEILTPEEFVSFMAQGEDTYIDYLVFPKDLLLQMLFGAEMDHYVDEENKSCSFDSEEFVGFLEKLAALEDLEMIGDRTERATFFHSGQLPVVVEELNCMMDYLCIREAFSGSGRITGFPNSKGEQRYPARLYDWMGINSASEYKEEAWSFIQFCIAYTSHSDNVSDRFVIMEDKFNEQTQFSDREELLIWPNDYDYWTGYQKVAPTTQEDSDFLWEVTEHLYLYENPSLMEVINEEASAFFAGDINAKEAAERIQNRASLVIGE